MKLCAEYVCQNNPKALRETRMIGWAKLAVITSLFPGFISVELITYQEMLNIDHAEGK